MLLFPNDYFKSVVEITYEYLNKNNINALILDVDNTLIDYDKNLSQDIVKWSKDLKNNDIKMIIVSNSNQKEKVKNVADKLEIDFIYFAAKPFKRGFKKAQKKLGINNENIAAVGDQIFTDIIGANRMNMYSILVEPIAKKDIFVTKIKRPIENYIKKKYMDTKEER